MSFSRYGCHNGQNPDFSRQLSIKVAFLSSSILTFNLTFLQLGRGYFELSENVNGLLEQHTFLNKFLWFFTWQTLVVFLSCEIKNVAEDKQIYTKYWEWSQMIEKWTRYLLRNKKSFVL